VPLPKSDNPDRIRENAEVWGFALNPEEMQLLDAMDQGMAGAVVPQYTECP
jgi:diketogulonate reductase-like aldo/keto reductase